MRDIVISQEFQLLFSCQNGYIREEKLLQKLIIAMLKKGIAELVEQLNEAFNSSSFTIYKTRFFYQCSFGKRI